MQVPEQKTISLLLHRTFGFIGIYMDINNVSFRLRTKIFIFNISERWHKRSLFPLISMKKTRKTYYIPRSRYHGDEAPVYNYTYKVVLTCNNQRRQLTIFDSPSKEKAFKKVQEITNLLGVIYVKWGERIQESKK